MVAVAASLVGSGAVRHAQVAVTGIVAGDVVTVTREWTEPAGARVETVRGGHGTVATSTALLLVDVAAPFGTPVVYRAEVAGASATATVTLPEVSPLLHVLSDPATGSSVTAWLQRGPEQRGNAFRGSLLRPAGRSRAVALFDARADDAGTWQLFTDGVAAGAALRTLLAYGGPLVHRPGSPGRRDFPGTETVQPLDVSRSLADAASRSWELTYEVVDDPDPDLVIGLSTLQDIADAYTGQTLGDLAADYVGQTLLDVAMTDWASL